MSKIPPAAREKDQIRSMKDITDFEVSSMVDRGIGVIPSSC